MVIMMVIMPESKHSFQWEVFPNTSDKKYSNKNLIIVILCLDHKLSSFQSIAKIAANKQYKKKHKFAAFARPGMFKISLLKFLDRIFGHQAKLSSQELMLLHLNLIILGAPLPSSTNWEWEPIETRAEKSKSLIRRKRLKGGKRRKRRI